MIQSVIDQQDREIDELLRLLNLDPDQYRTDGGSVNMPKVRAALAHPDEYPRLTAQPSALLRVDDAAVHE